MRPWLLAALLLICPFAAGADTGDRTIGPFLSGAWPAEGRLGAVVRLGVGDWLSLDARLGAAVDADGVAGVGSVGVVAAWDVLAWVPELRLAGGGRAGEGGFDPRVIAELGVRHYLSMDLSLLLAAGGEWQPEQWRAVLTLGVLFDL